MKTLILYKSRSGATKQYATWLEEELKDSEVCNADELSSIDFTSYERVIVCSATYGGIIIIREDLDKFWDKIKDKQIFLLVVGMVPQAEAWSETAFNALPKDFREALAGYVKLPGISTNKEGKEPSWFEKLMLKLFLKTDPEKISKQTSLNKADLSRFLAMLNQSS